MSLPNTIFAQADTIAKTKFFVDGVEISNHNEGWVFAGPDAMPYRYSEGVLCQGEFLYFYKSGALKHRGFYRNGRINGKSYDYYENGQIERSGVMYDGSYVGYSISYYENGIVRGESYNDSLSDLFWLKEYYESGQIEDSRAQDSSGNLLHIYGFEESQDTFYAIEQIDSVNLIYSYYFKYDNGKIEHEGFFCYHPKRKKKQVGTWKYYNEEGELVETKEFMPLKELKFDE